MVPNAEHALLIQSSNKEKPQQEDCSSGGFALAAVRLQKTECYSKDSLTAAGQSLAAETGSHTAG